jgi:hypothetical protein
MASYAYASVPPQGYASFAPAQAPSPARTEGGTSVAGVLTIVALGIVFLLVVVGAGGVYVYFTQVARDPTAAQAAGTATAPPAAVGVPTESPAAAAAASASARAKRAAAAPPTAPVADAGVNKPVTKPRCAPRPASARREGQLDQAGSGSRGGTAQPERAQDSDLCEDL